MQKDRDMYHKELYLSFGYDGLDEEFPEDEILGEGLEEDGEEIEEEEDDEFSEE